MGYSLISALLIALMPFLKSFHTGMGVDVRNLTNMGSSGASGGASGRGGSRQYTYQLEQLSKRSKHSHVVTTLPADDTEALAAPSWENAQPKQVSSKSRVAAERAEAVPDKMVIRETTSWSVRYDDENSHP